MLLSDFWTKHESPIFRIIILHKKSEFISNIKHIAPIRSVVMRNEITKRGKCHTLARIESRTL